MIENREIYAETRLANERPSTVVAYALWFFLGYLGAHRFYLGRIGTGLMMLGLFGIGTLTAPILIGWIPLAIVGIWWVLDIILTARIISDRMDQIRAEARSHWLDHHHKS